MAKYLLLCLILFFSCTETEKDKITRLVREMEGKEIVFPDNIIYTVYGTDTVDYVVPERKFTIVSYVDSIGCTSCKLQLYRWKDFVNEMDSLSDNSLNYQFVFHPKDKKELYYLFKRDNFDLPVWIDLMNDFNRLNNIPEPNAFHTFLLDSDNKIVAIGNPVNNPKIKELFYEVILHSKPEKFSDQAVAQIEIDEPIIDMGEFDWKGSRQKKITLKNTGNHLLLINDIIASCGCIKVEYSKEPVKPGGEQAIDIIYKAEYPEFFSKTLKIYANTEISPIEITVKGVSK